jgi:alkylation response protein AidB-like acyl-CoA dehydrogenase
MDLELSDDEAALRDNVRAVLAGICPVAVVRAVFEGEDPPAELWTRMVELGWPALAIDETVGGLGLGFVELALVAEEFGRAVVPGPFLATTTQFAPAVRELGGPASRARFLAPVASEGKTGTLAIADDARWTGDAVRTRAVRRGEAWAVTGTKRAVVDGATADDVVVIARGEAGLGAFVVPGAAVTASPRLTLDPTLPLADLHLDNVMVDADRVLAEPGAPGVEHALACAVQESVVGLAAMTVGACRQIFEATLAYAKAREQYGRPIGSFQALKHRLVEMYVAVERATALVYYAALAIAEDIPNRALAAAAAKAAAGDCQRLLAQDGLQLHGGIGFTWEHDLHFWLKRAKAGDALFGDAVAHRAALARLLALVPADSERVA